MLLGLLTRPAAILLLGIMIAAIFYPNLKDLTGLNLLGLQEFALIILLLGFCAEGAGSASLDRFLFKPRLVS